jgi:hypothetical protein
MTSKKVIKPAKKGPRPSGKQIKGAKNTSMKAVEYIKMKG